MTKTKEEILGELETELTDIEDYTDMIEDMVGNIRELLEELKEN